MFDETNQAMEGGFESELPENLFEDEEAGTEEPAETDTKESGSEDKKAQTEEAGDKEGGNHTDEKPTADGEVLRVKYNGEERDLSFDEARTLAQKGMNYDHVVEERDRNRNAFDFLSERAKGEGITVEELIAKEREKAENQRLEAKMEEIRERDDDASEETVKSLARLELEAEKKRAEAEKAKALEEKNKKEIEGWQRLFKEHPELIGEDGGAKVTQSVFDLVKNGYSPVEAYYIERNRELEQQNKVYSDAETAKKKSVGSLSGVVTSEEDDFLAGFEM